MNRAAAPIRVEIVDDHIPMRAMLRTLLESDPGIVIVGEASDGEEAVAVSKKQLPDIVLLDVAMPGTDGLTALPRILQASQRSRVIVFTMFDHDEAAYRALRGGAAAFVLKNAPPEEILRAVRLVQEGETVVAPELVNRLVQRWVEPRTDGLLHTLPEREREAVELIAAGLSNSEIADRMFVTETTVRTYVSRILAKTGARDRAQLVVMAYEQGIARSRH